MPSFAPAFPGKTDRMMSKLELVQVIRLDIASELEAIYLYEAHAHATDNVIAKKVLLDIADEEKVHVGELLTLLNYLAPDTAKHLATGEMEVREMMEEACTDPNPQLGRKLNTH